MPDSGDPISIARFRVGFDAWNAGDPGYVKKWLAPDALWEENEVGGFPDLDPVYVGPEGFAQWLDDMREAWDTIDSRAEEIIEVPSATGPSFVIETRLAARGREELAVDWRVYNVFWTREAREIIRRRFYFERAAAFDAAATDSSKIS